MSRRPPHARPLAEELSALLGPGTRYEGTLLFEGAVRIDGRLQGRADGGTEGILVVGEGGEVLGEIEVGTLIVRGGCVDGRVRAHRLVELHRGATLRGELSAAELFVEPGAVLESRCDVPAAARHPLGTAEEPATVTDAVDDAVADLGGATPEEASIATDEPGGEPVPEADVPEEGDEAMHEPADGTPSDDDEQA